MNVLLFYMFYFGYIRELGHRPLHAGCVSVGEFMSIYLESTANKSQKLFLYLLNLLT